LDYNYLERLKRHSALRLLNAESAPLIISFFYLAFVKTNARTYPQSALSSMLEDHLFQLRETIGDKYPRPAQEYLDNWANGENSFLRKYYPERGDEPQFDLTPASEKAIDWLRSLEQRPFVGTESRLLIIFQMLQEVIQATETDPKARLAVLERKKVEVEAEIVRVKAGEALSYDPTRVKERYYQIEDMARRLLADFRQVEENFRDLDRRTREKIATSSKGKGKLLDEIFGEEDEISNSDEGKSFRAFWEFLMSPDRQQQLQELAEKLLALNEVKTLAPDDLLFRLKYRLMDAGENVKRTLSSLIEDLRRFLDDQAWLENKRIMELIRAVERRGVAIRQNPPQEISFVELDGIRPDINLTMARGLFIPSKKVELEDIDIIEGQVDFESDALYNIHFVDESLLRDNIRAALRNESQVTLQQICEQFPLEKGLSELLVYLNIASKDDKAVIDPANRQNISWWDNQGFQKQAVLPRVIFTKARMAIHE
jgi:hypothetical protein